MNMRGRRVLIAGAFGRLRTATMTALVESGFAVVGIDRRAGDAPFADDTIVAEVTNEVQVEEDVAAAIALLGGRALAKRIMGRVDIAYGGWVCHHQDS
jgi:NAD(P)-dependent dehydrogenase (short-subunit alcohol dehydrogenase family)